MGRLTQGGFNEGMTNHDMAAAPRANRAGHIRGKHEMSGLIQTVTVAAAVGAGLIGGVFFAFSAFVMPALRRLPAVQGIGAMQSINRLAVTAPLMLALFGTAVLSVVAVIWAIRFRGHAAPWMLTGGAAYIVAILITIAGNVPLNNALAGLDPTSPAARPSGCSSSSAGRCGITCAAPGAWRPAPPSSSPSSAARHPMLTGLRAIRPAPCDVSSNAPVLRGTIRRGSISVTASRMHSPSGPGTPCYAPETISPRRISPCCALSKRRPRADSQ